MLSRDDHWEHVAATMSDFPKLVIVAVLGVGFLFWVVEHVVRTEFGVELTDLLRWLPLF